MQVAPKEVLFSKLGLSRATGKCLSYPPMPLQATPVKLGSEFPEPADALDKLERQVLQFTLEILRHSAARSCVANVRLGTSELRCIARSMFMADLDLLFCGSNDCLAVRRGSPQSRPCPSKFRRLAAARSQPSPRWSCT